VPSRYQELPPDPDLAGHLQCAWTSVIERMPGQAYVLPDACIDIIWLGGRLVVAGPDTGHRLVPMPPGTSIAAVRFRPGAAPALLGAPAAEIRDQTVRLAALWGQPAADELADRIAGVAGPAARVAALQQAIRGRLPGAAPVDPMAGGLVATLRGARPAPVAVLAAEIGLSERQLHRRCVAAFGYGPKTLDRVLRLQRFLALARSAGRSTARSTDGSTGRSAGRPLGGLAALAAAAGYTDQAHLSHECRALAGATPTALLA
jgi:AraC-like DNA-binding protein